MNRRNFFQTLLAGAAALFLPKSKKAEGEYYNPDLSAEEMNKNYDEVLFTFDSGSNNDDVSIDIYAIGFDGTYRKLTEEELKNAIFAMDDHEAHKAVYLQNLRGNLRRWGLHKPSKENQNG